MSCSSPGKSPADGFVTTSPRAATLFPHGIRRRRLSSRKDTGRPACVQMSVQHSGRHLVSFRLNRHIEARLHIHAGHRTRLAMVNFQVQLTIVTHTKLYSVDLRVFTQHPSNVVSHSNETSLVPHTESLQTSSGRTWRHVVGQNISSYRAQI